MLLLQVRKTKILSICLFSGAVFAQEDFRKNPPKPKAAPKINLGKTENFTLENGLKVIVVENTKLPRVSFQLTVDVPLHLEKGASGTSEIAGGLLRRGTTTKTKAEIDESIDFIGASLSTSGSGIFGSSLTKHKDALLTLMSEILLNPSFPQEEFDKAKTQTLSGLAASKENPGYIAGNVYLHIFRHL